MAKSDFVQVSLIVAVLGIYACFTHINFNLIHFGEEKTKLPLQSQFVSDVADVAVNQFNTARLMYLIL